MFESYASAMARASQELLTELYTAYFPTQNRRRSTLIGRVSSGRIGNYIGYDPVVIGAMQKA